MYKKSILLAALVSGVYASENPFAVEKNVQKIEQEESTLLRAIAKEQKTLETEDDEFLEEGDSESETEDVKQEESAALLEVEVIQKPEVEETQKEVEKSKPAEVAPPETKKEETMPLPVEEVAKKVEIREIKKEDEVTRSKEVTSLKTKTDELAAPTVEETAKKPELQAADKPVVAKKESSAEKQSEGVDTDIEKPKEKLEASKAKPAIVDEVSEEPDVKAELQIEANASAESNATFEQELQEAIKSVQG